MPKIEFVQQRAKFAPADLMVGTVDLQDLPADTHKLAIRLIWFTTGKGTRDVNVCSEIMQASVPPHSSVAFEFVAPQRPLSFSGQLISLQWAVEVVAFPSKQSWLAELVITHGEHQILLADAKDELKQVGIQKPVLQINGG